MAQGLPVRNNDKRQLRLGSHSSHLKAVTQGFEAELGMEPEVNPNLAWMRQVIDIFNRKNGTKIEYSHEDYGYWFKYSNLEDLEKLERVHAKLNL